VLVFVILCVANAVIHETCLPYFKSKMNFPFRAIGETALDEIAVPFPGGFPLQVSAADGSDWA
jgi:hypothetical protein